MLIFYILKEIDLNCIIIQETKPLEADIFETKFWVMRPKRRPSGNSVGMGGGV